MLEQTFSLSRGNEKAIEKVLFDENVNYIHMVLPQNEGLPVHDTNSTLYMTVVRGTLSIGLGEQEVHEYESGTMIKIPNMTKMDVRNLHTAALELIIVKAPPPAA